jgi:multiple sugar transport system ATP-binding protein
MAQVVFERLSKTFAGPSGAKVRALDSFSLTVEAGELLTLIGPSGCGKTTALRLLAGLETPDAGTLSLDGKVLNDVPPQDREVAMVFQSHALYPHLTARENLAFGLTLRRRPKSEIARRVGELAEMLGLGDCLERLPRELSGGQRQRVALGRALARRPKVLLLDEPLSSLDTPLRLQLRTELAKLHQTLRATWIYVTHDQGEAVTLGRRLAVMRDGALCQVDVPERIRQSPANEFVASFLHA